MLLGLSGEHQGQQYDLTGVTNEAVGGVGIANDCYLIELADAVFYGDKQQLDAIREKGVQEIGEQALVDAIAVASGFNGITKIANATGLPLDSTTEASTTDMRAETHIDNFQDQYKAKLYQ